MNPSIIHVSTVTILSRRHSFRIVRLIIAFAVLFCQLCLPAYLPARVVLADESGASEMSRPPSNAHSSEARVSEALSRAPLSFEPNQGQSDPRVKFLSRGSGYHLYLTSTEAVLAIAKPSAKESQKKDVKGDGERAASKATGPTSFALTMKMVGCSSPAFQHPAISHVSL